MESGSKPDPKRGPKRDGKRDPGKQVDPKTVRLAAAGVVLIAIVVVLAIVLIGGSSSDSSDKKAATTFGAVGLSESDLIDRAGSLEHPAYWLGPKKATSTYELTSTNDGRIYVRYLTGDAKAGDTRADFVTVGTYAVPGADAALDKSKAAAGGQITKGDGYRVLSESKSATSAYVVFDDQPDLQIEIFAPKPGQAAELAASGALEQVG